ncbi:hypothetical protein ACEQUB_03485 [Ralstonia syzygii]
MFKRHRPAAPSTPAPGANSATSLRLHLLRALATPLFGLVVGTGALSYWLAAHYTAQVFDRALVGVANALAEQLRLAGPRVSATQLFDIALAAQTLVQSSGEDRVYWRIAGPTGTLAGREALLGYGSGQVHMGEARVFTAGSTANRCGPCICWYRASRPRCRGPHPHATLSRRRPGAMSRARLSRPRRRRPRAPPPLWHRRMRYGPRTGS